MADLRRIDAEPVKAQQHHERGEPPIVRNAVAGLPCHVMFTRRYTAPADTSSRWPSYCTTESTTVSRRCRVLLNFASADCTDSAPQYRLSLKGESLLSPRAKRGAFEAQERSLAALGMTAGPVSPSCDSRYWGALSVQS